MPENGFQGQHSESYTGHDDLNFQVIVLHRKRKRKTKKKVPNATPDKKDVRMSYSRNAHRFPFALPFVPFAAPFFFGLSSSDSSDPRVLAPSARFESAATQTIARQYHAHRVNMTHTFGRLPLKFVPIISFVAHIVIRSTPRIVARI